MRPATSSPPPVKIHGPDTLQILILTQAAVFPFNIIIMRDKNQIASLTLNHSSVPFLIDLPFPGFYHKLFYSIK